MYRAGGRVIDFWIAFSNVVSSWGGSSDKLGPVTAGRADLSAAHDLLARPVSRFLAVREPNPIIRNNLTIDPMNQLLLGLQRKIYSLTAHFTRNDYPIEVIYY